MQRTLLLLLVLVSSQIFAQTDLECFIQDPKGSSLSHNVDMLEMDLKVSFVPEEGKVIGEVTYDFQCLQPKVDTLFLHAPAIDIKSVMMDDEILKYRLIEKGIVIEFDNTLGWGEPDSEGENWDEYVSSNLKSYNTYTITIEYEAHPKKGIYFIGWNDPTDRMRKQIWTQGQGIDNRHWIPSWDHQNDKLLTNMEVTFDSDYEIISNGVVTFDEELGGGMRTVRYEMKQVHSSYLVMLAIGMYDVKEMIANNGVVTYQYYYPGEEERFEPTYQYSNEMMDWLEEELGVPYQWDKYANVPVADFLYGAMENTTATTFTDYYFRDERGASDRNYIGTNCHELTHHWFGDLITAWGGTHHWLHESFATHYAKHFLYSIKGEDHFAWQRRGEMRSAWNANSANNKPIAHSEAGSARHYPQGSIVLDMMRYILGDDSYRAAIQFYLEDHAFKNVDSDDLMRSILERTGVNMDWFFKEWVYKGGHPVYKIEYALEGEELVMTIEQTQEISNEVGLFEMPFYWEAHLENGEVMSQRNWVRGPFDTLRMSGVTEDISFVLFDPGWQVLKKVDFVKSTDELIAQSANAPWMIDRYDAVKGLDSIETNQVMNHLIELYEVETFWAIRAEIIKQLSEFDNKKARRAMLAGVNDEEAKVRYAALKNAGDIEEDELPYFEPMLEDFSYANVNLAIDVLCEQYPDNANDYLKRSEGVIGNAREVELSWLKVAYKFEPIESQEKIIDYASQSFEFRTRINAANKAQDMGLFNEDLAINLLNGVLSLNRRLAGPFKRVTKEYMADEAKAGVFQNLIDSGDWDERQQKILDELTANLED